MRSILVMMETPTQLQFSSNVLNTDALLGALIPSAVEVLSDSSPSQTGEFSSRFSTILARLGIYSVHEKRLLETNYYIYISSIITDSLRHVISTQHIPNRTSYGQTQSVRAISRNEYQFNKGRNDDRRRWTCSLKRRY